MQGSINFDGSLVGNITGGGGGGDTVVITPVVTSGTKIADVSVNGVEKDLYCPTPTEVSVSQVQQSGTKIATIGVNGVNTDIYTPEGGGSDVEITPVVTSGTKIANVSVGGVEKDLYTPDYGADIAALDGRLDIAEDNITSLTGRVGTAEGNITNLAGHMTEAETDITEIKQSLSLYDKLGYPFNGATTLNLFNCTGTIINDLNYVIAGNMMAIGGRVRINNITRTGGNCGVQFTIPENRLLAEIYNTGYPISLSSYSDGVRNGESTMISFRTDIGMNKFIINVTESYANIVNGKTLVLIVPLCFIRLAPT